MKSSQQSRREILVNSARAFAGLAFTASCQPLFKGSSLQPCCAAGSGFKIGVCDWMLNKQSDPGSFEIAKKLGADGVQVSMGTMQNQENLCDPQIQQTFLKAAQQNGMQISSLGIATLNNIPYKSDPLAEQLVVKSIDVCKALGINVVLVAFFEPNGDLRGDKKGTDVVVERLKKVAPKAEKAGVFLCIESWLSAEQHMDIINRVGSPAVRVYYDLGNSHLRGYDIYKEIRFLGSRICEFHAKDYEFLFGKGKVDFVKARQAMDDIGYRGWIQVEGAMPLGLEASYRHDVEYLHTVFPPRV